MSSAAWLHMLDCIVMTSRAHHQEAALVGDATEVSLCKAVNRRQSSIIAQVMS